MQAIILAVGMGKRLGEYTANNTKYMAPVNKVRLVNSLPERLLELNPNIVVLIVGYEGQKQVDYIGENYCDRLLLKSITNPFYV